MDIDPNWLFLLWPLSGWIGGVICWRCASDLTVGGARVIFLFGAVMGPVWPLMGLTAEALVAWRESRPARTPKPPRAYREPIVLLRRKPCWWSKP